MNVRHVLRSPPFVDRLLLMLLVCQQLATAASAQQSDLGISDAWMRFILPGRPAAGYFTLTNATARPRILTSATSPGCKSLMLHKSVSVNGLVQMIMETSAEVPAHGTLIFAPLGEHLMCLSPSADVRPGRHVPVTLTFADGTTLTHSFEVRSATGK